MSGFMRKMGRKQMKADDDLMERVVRDHLDVLQNIEAVLVHEAKVDAGIDDAVCHGAIESVLSGMAAK